MSRDGTVRPSMHAIDGSYASFFLAYQGLNVSVEFSNRLPRVKDLWPEAAGDDSLVLLVEAVGCVANCSDFVLIFEPGMAYGPVRSGRVSSAPAAFEVAATGGSPTFVRHPDRPANCLWRFGCRLDTARLRQRDLA